MSQSVPPNVVYILADDMGYGDLSCLDERSRLQTVNLDRMATQGAVFRDEHSSSAVCTPSRYNILTGRYNWRSRLKSAVTQGYDGPLIERGRLTLAEMLRGAGYHTACIGKWHLGLEWQRRSSAKEDVDFTKPLLDCPLDHGFDEFFGISGSLDMPPYVYIDGRLATSLPNRLSKNTGDMDFWREGPAGADFVHEEVMEKLTERVCDAIRRLRGRRFFIYYVMTGPHTPILPTSQFRGISGTNNYGDFVMMCDAMAGKILDELDRQGLSENTLVVFTSDNGCSPRANFGELAACGHNPSYHFRGHKADIYEGGHRVPLVMRWPGVIPSGHVCDSLVCLGDFMATVAEYLGVRLPPDAAEDSVSNLSLWKGGRAEVREALVHHSNNGNFSIRQGRWKLEFCPGSGGWSDPRPGEESADAPRWQLCDLEADVSERKNLIFEQCEIARHLWCLMKKYFHEGRSTPGPCLKNEPADPWPGVDWLEDDDFLKVPSAGCCR